MTRRLLLLVLAVCVGAWLVLLLVERSYREGPNYSPVEDGLYLGGAVAEPPPGTAAVLNLCEQADPYRREAHRWDPIRDAAPAPDLDWLRRAVGFVDANRKAGRATYVHCRNGVSRGGLVVVAHLMAKHGWTRDEALALVRTRRPQVRPNPAFMALLLQWERALKEQPAGGAVSAPEREGRPARGRR